MSRPSRRRFLAGALLGAGALSAAAWGVEQGVLPGRGRLYSGLGLNGTDTPLPPVEPGPKLEGSFVSEYRDTRVGWTIAYPPGAEAGASLPVVVGLHGRSDDHTTLFGDRIGLDRQLSATSQSFAIAAVDGGDTYWHPRRSGEDAGAMVVEEFLPLLTSQNLLTDRIGLYGYSMGGYGALRLAGILGPGRVAAVVVVSAAVFRTAGDTPPGTFDDQADFAAHDVMGRQRDLDGIPVRLDCGRGDSFAPAVQHYRAGFSEQAEPAGGVQPGAHDDSYWRRVAPAELLFLGRYLQS